MKPVCTLILIADDGRARFMENRGVGKGLQEIAKASAGVTDVDLYADRPGRSQAAPGMAAHVVERKSSEEEQARMRFAEELVDRAAQLFARGGYDRFAMIAPPRMLGALRQKLGGELASRLLFDMPADLTKSSDERILARVSKVMAV